MAKKKQMVVIITVPYRGADPNIKKEQKIIAQYLKMGYYLKSHDEIQGGCLSSKRSRLTFILDEHGIGHQVMRR